MFARISFLEAVYAPTFAEPKRGPERLSPPDTLVPAFLTECRNHINGVSLVSAILEIVLCTPVMAIDSQ